MASAQPADAVDLFESRHAAIRPWPGSIFPHPPLISALQAITASFRASAVDLAKKIWTVPASRMKAGRAHRVPLSPRAVAILHRLKELKASEFVFPGQSRTKPLSNNGHGDGFAPDEGRGCHCSRL